jgi:hypothetical protein
MPTKIVKIPLKPYLTTSCRNRDLQFCDILQAASSSKAFWSAFEKLQSIQFKIV